MWGYIYLSIFLDGIDISDHNAIQKFVYDMVSRYCSYDECRWLFLAIDLKLVSQAHLPLIQWWVWSLYCGKICNMVLNVGLFVFK